MNIKWKNSPYQLKEKFCSPREGNVETVQVESCCDHELYIWDWYSGRRGTKNEKTMVYMSHLFSAIISSTYDLKIPHYQIIGS